MFGFFKGIRETGEIVNLISKQISMLNLIHERESRILAMDTINTAEEFTPTVMKANTNTIRPCIKALNAMHIGIAKAHESRKTDKKILIAAFRNLAFSTHEKIEPSSLTQVEDSILTECFNTLSEYN